MQVLVGYATSEGQTRKIARFAADHLSAGGHNVELLALSDADDVELGRFDRIVLAGSLHGGGYQRDLRQFASARVLALQTMPSLFLSVSLTAAGDDPADWDGLRKADENLFQTTRWRPGRVEHLAGAFRFTEYNLFEAWAMRHIASQRDPDLDTHADTEYTDWQALADILDDWAGRADG